LVYIVVFVLAFFSPNRKSDGWANWRLALLWSLCYQDGTAWVINWALYWNI